MGDVWGKANGEKMKTRARGNQKGKGPKKLSKVSRHKGGGSQSGQS